MATTDRNPMSPTRKAALIAAVAHLATFVGSVPALPLYDRILNDPRYLLGGASDTGVLYGAVGEIVCAPLRWAFARGGPETWCRRGDLNPHALSGTSPSS